MNRIGPILETLLRRLADTPPDFLDEPQIEERGEIFVPALIHDLFSRFGYRVSSSVLQSFQGRKAEDLDYMTSDMILERQAEDRNHLSLVMILVWLLADDWFVRTRPEAEAMFRLLAETARELAASTAAQQYVHDMERREELARLTLARLGFRPEGETEAEATDRLSALSETERRRLIQASREAEARARAVREALIRKQALEAADKWTRE